MSNKRGQISYSLKSPTVTVSFDLRACSKSSRIGENSLKKSFKERLLIFFTVISGKRFESVAM